MKSDTYTSPPLQAPEVKPPIPRNDWRDKYAPIKTEPKEKVIIPDDTEINNPLKIKIFDRPEMVLGEPGKVYFDKTTGQVRIYIDDSTGWVYINTTAVP